MYRMLPSNFTDCRIHLIGIKGSGMASLAEVLHTRGAILSGSDVSESFSTENTLKKLHIPYINTFAAENIPPDTEYVIYSRAWNNDEHPEILESKRRNLPLFSYNDALGSISKHSLTLAISGTHGKTSTTALSACLARAANMPATVITGGGMLNFNKSGVFHGGEELFIVEACEYQHGFLALHPDILAISNIEWEHPDYYRDTEDVIQAFAELARKLPENGVLIYSMDCPSSMKCIEQLKAERSDIRYISYGHADNSDYHIDSVQEHHGYTSFTLNGSPLQIQQPGKHLVDNTCLAIAAITSMQTMQGLPAMDDETIVATAKSYLGTQRRSEIRARFGGITCIDDYAHHPTAIAKTLASYKQFFNAQRIVLDFMPHTFSRSKVFISDFSHCFSNADVIVLNDIYASAREKTRESITGREFAETIEHPDLHFEPDLKKAASYISKILQPGDLFASMGAGNNWQVTDMVIQHLQTRKTTE